MFKINQNFVLLKRITPMALMWVKWLLGFMVAAVHPFYISVTEINHNESEKSLEISCKIFAEDMEEVLKKSNKGTINLSEAKNHDQNDKMIEAYVRQHLVIIADGKPVTMQFLGFEKEKESIYCYFEAKNIASVKKLDLTNSLLQDFSDQQINIMHVTVKGERKSQKLDHPKKQATFSF